RGSAWTPETAVIVVPDSVIRSSWMTELDSRAERLRLSVMARRKGGCKRDPFTHDACRDYTGISENQPRRRLIGIFKLAHEQQTTLGQALANARSRIIGMTPPIRRKSLSSMVSMAAVAC